MTLQKNNIMKPRIKAPLSEVYFDTKNIVDSLNLKTVCEEAACPNISNCWSKRHATFMILGNVCTRSCRFCNVKTGKPGTVDEEEPKRVAQAVFQMNLSHVVITSVDRDDLIDGGANHFSKTIECIRSLSKNTTIEILTPDFLNKEHSIDIIVDSKPDVFNHNLETVPRLYQSIRPGARYFNSLYLLKKIKEKDKTIFTKSGLMVGLGETKSEIYQVMDDLRSANVDFITIGQYLRPTPNHATVERYVDDEEFKDYERMAIGKGFLMASCSALTRSSFHAGDDFIKLKERNNRLTQKS